MKVLIVFFCAFLSLSLLSACRRPQPKTAPKTTWSNAHSVDFNQELSAREELKIATFLAHYRELSMQKTNSGLRYMIYKNGIGESLAKTGQYVNVRVKIELLNGTICYETPS